MPIGEQYIDDTVSVNDASTVINVNETYNKESIIGFDAIYNSMWRCRKGVMWKDSVCSFVLNGIEQSLKLEYELDSNKYVSRPPKGFTILHPKKREITSIVFRDRVYQRSLNDNCIYPVMSNSFIYDNAACQKDKGTDKARNRMKCFLQRRWRKSGRNFYVLQIDIHGYYPNMNHANAEQVFKKKLPEDVFNRIVTILHQQYAGDVGYNAGSQLIQIAGISVLNELDHYIKEVLHIKQYIRYMDDLILIHDNKDYLEFCKSVIGDKLEEIGFSFNPKKTRIYPVKEGITFLGFTFKLTTTGKVLMMLSADNVKHERRKLKKLVGLAKKGLRSRAKVYECYASWRNHASKGNNYNLLLRMDKYLKNLWGDTNEVH